MGSTPRLVEEAGGNARFAWKELFSAELRNPHTRRAYLHAVRQFLDWCESHRLELRQITPGWLGTYYDELHSSIPTKKQHLSALRCFFDRLVLRHAVPLNPASSVRGERYQLAEGKTPEITVDQERALLKSIRPRGVEGLRDKAIVATLIYTAARIGAVAGLTVGSFAQDGGQWFLRFLENALRTQRETQWYQRVTVRSTNLARAMAMGKLLGVVRILYVMPVDWSRSWYLFVANNRHHVRLSPTRHGRPVTKCVSFPSVSFPSEVRVFSFLPTIEEIGADFHTSVVSVTVGQIRK